MLPSKRKQPDLFDNTPHAPLHEAVVSTKLLTTAEPIPAGFDVLLTPKQCAVLVGVRPSTLQTWRALGAGPRFVKLSRRTVRYPMAGLMDWLNAAA
jgi:hypothetical protein